MAGFTSLLAKTCLSASHPNQAVRSCLNLEGYSVDVVLRFVVPGPPNTADYRTN